MKSLRVYPVLVVAALLLLAGCTLWPSSWRIGGTPLDKEKKAAQKVALAQGDAVGAAQRAVWQTGQALALAGKPIDGVDVSLTDKALTAARDFNAEAQALLDQARGAPGAANEAAWRKVVTDLIAGNDKARREQAEENAALSRKLTKLEAAHDRTLSRVAQYAAENAGLADWVRKLAWIAIGFVVLIVGSHLLGLAAHLNPGSAVLGKLASGAGSLLASGAVLAKTSAERGLQQVGAGLALVRQKLPAVAEEVTAYLDASTATHPTAQTHVAAGATAAGAPPSA